MHDPALLQLSRERNERRRPILEKLEDDIHAAHDAQHKRIERAAEAQRAATAALHAETEAANKDFHDAKKRLRAAADKEIKKIDRDYPDLEPWSVDR